MQTHLAHPLGLQRLHHAVALINLNKPTWNPWRNTSDASKARSKTYPAKQGKTMWWAQFHVHKTSQPCMDPISPNPAVAHGQPRKGAALHQTQRLPARAKSNISNCWKRTHEDHYRQIEAVQKIWRTSMKVFQDLPSVFHHVSKRLQASPSVSCTRAKPRESAASPSSNGRSCSGSSGAKCATLRRPHKPSCPRWTCQRL